MQTPTHFLMTAALRYPLQKQEIPVRKIALLVGSVLPDLPFALLSLVYGLFYRVVGKPDSAATIMDHLHSLYFTDPVWVAAHNTPHSLVVNGVLIGLGYWLWRRGRSAGLTLFWLAVAMQLHTIIDIFTHYSDGPLFLFPLNWTYRFHSPISYWESGWWFIVLEYTLDAILLLFLIWKWRHNTQFRSFTAT